MNVSAMNLNQFKIPRRLMILIAIFSGGLVNAQSLEWVGGFGGNNSDGASIVATDSSENIYVVGYFNGTIDVDPGPGVFNLSSDNFTNHFLLKLNAEGEFIWAFELDGQSTKDMVVGDDGSVHLTGEFQVESDFDPGPGEAILSTQSGINNDVYVSKFNSNGEFLWVKQFTGISNDIAGGLGVDSDDNVLVSGTFFNSIDFDPGPDQYILEPEGHRDAFVCKLDNNGDFQWVKTSVGTGVGTTNHSDTWSDELAIDSDDNIYIGGRFRDSVDFDPNEFSTKCLNGISSNGYIWKLDQDGSFLWVKQIVGPGADSWINDFAFNSDDALYVAGSFMDYSIDVNPGADTVLYESNGGKDLFVLRLDSDGSYNWSGHLGGYNNDQLFGIDVDSLDNIYLTGSFDWWVDFDFGPDTFSVFGEDDIFIIRYTESGSLDWFVNWPNSAGIDIKVITSGNLVTVGRFKDEVDFDPGPLETTLNAQGVSNDGFILKYGMETLPTSLDEIDPNQLGVYPNPSSGPFRLKSTSEANLVSIVVYNSFGELINFKENMVRNMVDFILPEASGIYLIRASFDDGDSRTVRVVRR